MKDLKPYIIELKEDETMKPKVYPNNCRIEGLNWRLVIVITYNECIFSINNDIW